MASPSPELPLPSSAVFRLPAEVTSNLFSYLPNSALKSLRLTCRFFASRAALRLVRAFLSANPRNVDVFNAIAAHDVYRKQITHIIWDDALLLERERAAMSLDPEDYVDPMDAREAEWEEEQLGCPPWFNQECEENLFNWNALRGDDVNRPGHILTAQQVADALSPRDAWRYYQTLLEQQRDVLASQAHAHAFETNIGRFPALRSIIITPAAHGRLFNPLYETPMIRSFPRGFNYPIPNWLGIIDGVPSDAPEWDVEGEQWQGFRVVMRVLAHNRQQHNVSEIRIDAYELESGLNMRAFAGQSSTMTDFEAVVTRPGFKHLHLDLHVDVEQCQVLHNGPLGRALAGANGGHGLECLSLGTNAPLHCSFDSVYYYSPLSSLFPSPSLSNLRHFGLSRFYVKESELVSLLAELPETLESIDLSFLGFIEGSYRGMLLQLRDTLGWRHQKQRPKISIRLDSDPYYPGRAIWVDEEVNEFIYGQGNNPFGDEPASGRDQVPYGIGLVRDVFEPEYERPWLSPGVLMLLGIHKVPEGWTSHHIKVWHEKELKDMPNTTRWRQQIQAGDCVGSETLKEFWRYRAFDDFIQEGEQ
ncbi:hypothetical protein DL767_010626 [Monosporascus sp. MG133]|nr:hypothetical protein DL767_010626 [Monosporascus sp. MG133]